MSRIASISAHPFLPKITVGITAFLLTVMGSFAQVLPKEPLTQPANPAPKPKPATVATPKPPGPKAPALEHEGVFEDWNYSQGDVFGLIKLENTSARSYYKIIKTSSEAYKIQHFNTAGIQNLTILVRFSNGKLSSITRADEWDDTYQWINFTPAGNDEFIVTQNTRGVNDMLPCKSARYIFKNNQLQELRYLSESGTIMNNINGEAIIKYKRYDDLRKFGLIKEESYFDTESSPIVSSASDSHQQTKDYDENGNLTQLQLFGNNMQPVLNRYGLSKIVYKYDDKSELLTQEYFGLNDEPINNSSGISKIEYRYKDGFRVKETRYDNRNTIVKTSGTGDGTAIVQTKYDGNGNLTTVEYFDENEQPINNHRGIGKIVYGFNAANMLTGVEYFNAGKMPVADQTNVHKYEYKRDEKGRYTQIIFFDIENNPVEDNMDQVYRRKYGYDDYGRITSYSYWKDETIKMNRWDGYHMLFIKFDADGLATDNIYYDQDNQFTKSNNGYSRVQFKYDKNSRRSQMSYFDNNNPISVPSGVASNYHTIRYSYDSRGRTTSLGYFDNSDQPVNANLVLETNFVCQRIDFSYKGNRIVQENCYTVGSDIPVKIIDCLTSNYMDITGVSPGYKNK